MRIDIPSYPMSKSTTNFAGLAAPRIPQLESLAAQQIPHSQLEAYAAKNRVVNAELQRRRREERKNLSKLARLIDKTNQIPYNVTLPFRIDGIYYIYDIHTALVASFIPVKRYFKPDEWKFDEQSLEGFKEVEKQSRRGLEIWEKAFLELLPKIEACHEIAQMLNISRNYTNDATENMLDNIFKDMTDWDVIHLMTLAIVIKYNGNRSKADDDEHPALKLGLLRKEDLDQPDTVIDKTFESISPIMEKYSYLVYTPTNTSAQPPLYDIYSY